MKSKSSYYPKNNVVLPERILKLGYATKREFAEKNNLSYSTLKHIHSSGIGPMNAVRIAEAAKTTVDYLFVPGRK